MRDACADRTPELHDAEPRDLDAKYADIATIEEVITRFGTLTAS